jgi:hypothetical protein
MIIREKYSHETFRSTHFPELYSTILEAKLRFGEARGLDNINIRLNPKYGYIRDYLNKFEEMFFDSSKEVYIDNTPKGREITRLRWRPWRNGLDIKIESNKPLKAEEMLDLKALNQFIFNGICPEIPKK